MQHIENLKQFAKKYFNYIYSQVLTVSSPEAPAHQVQEEAQAL